MKGYGLIEDIVELGAYILGDNKVPWIPYQEDGDWEPYLPKYEPQAEHFETNGCTVWGTQNQIETFYKRLYGIEPNFSERFNYLLTPVNPDRGVDPQKVYECIRKHGLIDHRLLPVTRTRAQFLDETDITNSMLAKGIHWRETHDFRHEWLWRNPEKRPANWKQLLKDALKTSPIGVSVTAWTENEYGLFVSLSGNNHYCLLYKIADYKGHADCMFIFDTYDHTKKVLHPDHNVRRAKRIWLNQTTSKRKLRKHMTILERIVDFIKKNLR